MRSLLGRALASIEEVFDAQKLKRHAADDILIVPYLGFGDGETAYVQGRVLFDNHIVPPTESDSLWTNLVNTWRRFESDEIPGARVRVTLFDSTQDCVTDEEGYFKAELHPRLPVVDDTAWCKVTVDLLDTPIDSDKTASAVGYVIIPPPDAQFAVVSDLDDTVMRTDVLNRLKMIHNTFLRNAYSRLPFEGVAAFYRALQAGTTQTTNPIFYVSSSPWNLYDAILDFYRIRHIPRGPIFLRDLGLHTKGNTAPGHHEHKMGHIRRLLETYTHLPFILIGDSGQKDPRIYMETIRRYPGRIKAVYIRNVTRNQRDEEIRELAKEAATLGTDMLLVDDTYAAARHAVAKGFIDEASLSEIRSERDSDESKASPIERMTEH